MHVPVDPNWLLQSTVLVLALALGFVCLVRNTVFRYFTQLDSDDNRRSMMATEEASPSAGGDSCAVCSLATKKHCSRCKMVKYCSEACQRSHWNSNHKKKCIDIRATQKNSTSTLRQRKASLSPALDSSKSTKQLNKILFPYEEFVKLFNWDTSGFPPCGLLNCGNSCFVNVVLQCLTYTRALVAYLLNKGHKRECRRNAWCFLCEFETHVERSTRSSTPFSPINILSRLPNIGGNLGYGQQEDAHEFMRFAIDTMQSVCLDEFGGEKFVHPKFQETTLMQHIFGGRLQSQVMCTECNNISNQFENMMDLTVEINGDAGSLEECLDQFTVKEWLHGDNMYKCDSCNAYVMAWKRLTIHRPPNILTIALKRFQSGRFGKLNKKVTFPESFDLSPYMCDKEDGQNTYELYAVIVHMDMLNASFFGHYICYVKDFSGNWYRVDDCEVAQVDVNEVLLQGAYMLMYKRACARPSSLVTTESLTKQQNEKPKIEEETNGSLIRHTDGPSAIRTIDDAKVVHSEGADLPISESRNGVISSSVHKEVSPSVKHTNQGNAASTTSIDEPSPDSNGRKIEISSPLPDGDNASQSISDPASDFTRMTDYESGGVEESCTLDEAIKNIDEAPCEAKSESSVPEVSNLVNGSVSADTSRKERTKKSSGAKQKPLFASGFLDKRKPINKNSQTNAREKFSENGLIWKDEHDAGVSCSIDK